MDLQNGADGQKAYPYKAILLASIVIRYCLEQYINIRQLRRTLITQMPVEVTALGTPYQQFILSQAYAMDKLTFQMLCLSMKTCLQCLLIMANVRPFIWKEMDSIFPFINMESQTQKAIGYVLIYMFISKAFMVPLQAYEMEIIDKKHRQIRKTLYSYVFGLMVEGVLTLVPIVPILIGYLRVVHWGGQLFYLSLQFFILVVTVIYAYFYPYATIFFNHFHEITEPQLRLAVQKLSLKSGFQLSSIKIKINGEYDMHGAQYHGFANRHFIAIYQSLLLRLEREEVVGVLCHEVGHWHHMHSLKSLLLYLVQNMTLFYIYSFFLNNKEVFKSFGFKEQSVFVGTALFYDLHTPLIAFFQYLSQTIKRRFEFDSDAYAVRLGYGGQLRSSLIKLYRENAPKIRPDPMYAVINYTHPTLYQRIEQIDRLMEESCREKMRSQDHIE